MTSSIKVHFTKIATEVNVNDATVVAFPRAYRSLPRENVPCDENTTEKLRAPCVCGPAHKHNLLLDTVVTLASQYPQTKDLCIALRGIRGTDVKGPTG